jgi:hypothetical protein
LALSRQVGGEPAFRTDVVDDLLAVLGHGELDVGGAHHGAFHRHVADAHAGLVDHQ